MTQGVRRCALVAALLYFWTQSGFAQQPNNRPLEEIQVLGERLFYSQKDTSSPILNYQKEYFQSFEPQSIGDMLKRVSGVAFTSDIGEFEAPQLRGLGPQYTQVLINGVRIPGISSDRVALVDRIPAEFIERVEVIRSPTADIDSQGIGGTINLVLREEVDLQGSDWRLGGLYYSDLDPTAKGSAAITHSGIRNDWSYIVSANIQERLGPKTKTEQAFDGEGNFLRIFNSDDIRQSTDKSFFGSLSYNLDNEEFLNFRFSYLAGQIDEMEKIENFNEELELDSNGIEYRDSDQDRLDFGVSYRRLLTDGMDFKFSGSVSQFDDDTLELEGVLEDGQEVTELQQFTRTDNLQLQIASSLSYRIKSNHTIELGLGASKEERNSIQSLLELDEEELIDTTPGNGTFKVEETRSFFYLKDIWRLSNDSTIELGVRGENTYLSQRGSDGLRNNSQFEFNPSVHYLRDVGMNGQLRVSLAKTLRRPNFSELIPFTNRDTPNEDQVTVGNPDLNPERALGFDIGYSHKFVETGGILGLNLFYRKLEDKIELEKIGEDVFTPSNVGDGEAWGFEVDFGMPLTSIGLPDLSFFTNYTLIDSKIKDPFTNETRRFNLQPDFIGNVDLVHNIPSFGVTHGLSFQKQGEVRDIHFDESNRVSYGTNLEYFIEKDFGESLTLRLSASNLLNARKREQGFVYDELSAFLAGELKESVFEREQAEPVFLITLRGTF